MAMEKNRKNIDVTSPALPTNQRKALIGMHAFSGNDYVSSFFRKEKDGTMPEDYYRYVDDTFNLTTDIGKANTFHQTLNDAHPSLAFAMEIQNDGQLPFLGMLM